MDRSQRAFAGKAAAAIVCMVGMAGHHAAGAEDTRADQLVNAVIAGIEKNYSRMTSMKAVTVISTDHSWVQEHREVRRELPDGGVIRYTETPKSEEHRRIVIRGNLLRSELFDPRKQKVVEAYIRNGDIWTQYVPDAKRAWVRREAGMPGLAFPFDPRQMGLLSIQDRFPDMLKVSRIRAASPRAGVGGRFLIEIVFSDSKGRKITVAFDSSVRFQPTQINYHHPNNDNVYVSTSIEYRHMPTVDVWFPLKGVIKVWDGRAKSPETEPCREKTIYLVRDLTLNAAVSDDVFRLALPEGTGISDTTRGR